MNYSAKATVTFGAGHPGNGFCGQHDHGHQYTVTVTFDREGYPATDMDQWVHARTLILNLALELKNRDLAKMLGPQVPNVFGVAAFFMERLSIVIPISSVEVREDDDPVAYIERTAEY